LPGVGSPTSGQDLPKSGNIVIFCGNYITALRQINSNFVGSRERVKTISISQMHKSDDLFMNDPDTRSKLTLAILLAYGIVMTGFLAIVGIIYLFSQMTDKYRL